GVTPPQDGPERPASSPLRCVPNAQPRRRRCRTRRSRGLQQSRLRQGRTGAPPVSVLSCHSPYEGHQVSPKRIPGGAELQDGRDVVVTLLVKHSWPGPSGGPPRFDQPYGLLLKARRVQLGDREQTGNVR